MLAAAWMSGTLLSFCLMAIAVRELSGALSVIQTLCVRSAIGLLCISLILVYSGGIRTLHTRRLKLHVFRNIFHLGGQYGWFWGIGLLPLAEVFALEFSVPIWTLVIAVLFLGERVTWHKLAALLLGVSGVLVIVQPGIAIVDAASFIVLASAICYAVAHSSTKSLGGSESPVTILFYMSLIQFAIALIPAQLNWVSPSEEQWAWMVLIGLTALTAHYCMIRAMRHAEISMIVTLDFLRLPLIAFVGVAIYSEDLELSLLAGGALMLLANLIGLNGQRGRELGLSLITEKPSAAGEQIK
jgi:drug/metabolite transporter (DMT)-like permease